MRSDHAIVVGGSISGVLAAAVLAEHFERVTVIERDQLEDAPVARKGVPQGNQIHVLLPVGETMIQEVFPGLHEECIEAGCGEYNLAADAPVLTAAGWQCRVELELAQLIAFRRPLLEWLMRRRLLRLENVQIRHATVTGLLAGEDGADVTGVALKEAGELTADLVVDAGGRGTKSPRWIEELGFDAPEVDEVRAYMGYTTQYVEVPEDLFEGETTGIAVLPHPGHPLGGVLTPADNGTYALTAIGMMKHYPPGDREGMLEFLDQLGSPLVAEMARRTEPVSEVRAYRQPSNLRRRWEELDRRPGRFIVIGDAVASFNPVYGQGITMAALGAKVLREALGDPGATLETMPAAFQEGLREGLDIAFATSAGADAFYEGAELQNFERPSEEEVHFAETLEQMATEDPAMVAAIMEASLCMRPEVLESEEVKSKTAAWVASEDRLVDPLVYPTHVHRGALADRR